MRLYYNYYIFIQNLKGKKIEILILDKIISTIMDNITNLLSNLNFNDNKKHDVKLYDPLYGIVKLGRYSGLIIDSYVFSRLKGIKQLGTLPFVHIHANHTRYEHSIGVAYLSRLTGESLQKYHPDITQRDIECLELAGLCHDLGHGPYSHSFDNLLSNTKNITKHHEVRSQILFRYVVDIINKDIDIGSRLSDSDIRLVQYFIDPKMYLKHMGDTIDKFGYPKLVGEFFHGFEQIVNNNVCNLDVDKMDYLNRDGIMLRLDQNMGKIDIISILERSKIIDGNWVFSISDQPLICDLVCRRYLYYNNIYLHPDINIIDYMFTEAFRILDKFDNFTNSSTLDSKSHIEKFIGLTDEKLLHRIINSTEIELKVARDLINCIIYKNPLYKHIGDFEINCEFLGISDYLELPLKTVADKSSPMNLLPKVKYHQNGIIINNKSVKSAKYVRRILADNK